MKLSRTYSLLVRIVNVLLLGVAFIELPYGFYQFVKVIVFVSAALFAYESYSLKYKSWLFIWVITSLLYNPIIPVHLNRELWLFLNGAALLIFSWGMLASNTQPRNVAEQNDDSPSIKKKASLPKEKLEIKGIEKMSVLLIGFQHQCIQHCVDLPWYESSEKTAIIWQEYVVYMFFALDMALEGKRADPILRQIVKSLAVRIFVLKVSDELNEVAASGFFEKRYARYEHVKKNSAKTTNADLLDEFISFSLASVSLGELWDGEFPTEQLAQQKIFFRQIAKIKLDSNIDLVGFDRVNTLAVSLLGMSNSLLPDTTLDKVGPTVSVTNDHRVESINDILIALDRHCDSRYRDLPWFQEHKAQSEIIQLEFFLYCCFILDVSCHMLKASNDIRKELTRSVENYLAARSPRLAEVCGDCTPRELYDHRNDYYTRLFSNDKDWLPKSINHFVDVSMKSVTSGRVFMGSGVILSNPVLTMDAFMQLTDDFINQGNILPIKLIIGSADLLVK
ncbi:MAG: hypothetical protein KC582_04045 [Candidatus Magasanikbacteria bacterium]|nr:hypothetical protein [Candidatus Magasanikbacteria bacterium]